VSAAAPWSVKGIEPKAREIAKDLARRSGMTLGEWLNTMIMEDGDDDGVVPLGRRAHAADIYERRGRSRRLDDAYGSSETEWDRLGASIDAIAARLEASEQRSTIAIQGVDQAVTGLVRRLDGQDQNGKTYGRRIDDIAEELREGHRRLRQFEQQVGPQNAEAVGKVETAVGALAGRLYDIEERQRTGANDLRQRMEAVEKAAGPGVGTDMLAQVGARLDEAQSRTTEALRGLERSFAGLDQRLRQAEGRVEPESAREAARFEKLAETLSRQVESSRIEMMRRLDTAETENRIDRIERAVQAIGDQVKASEDRSARAVEAMGREVLRIAENLNTRVQSMEGDGPARLDRIVQAATEAATSAAAETAGRQVETEMARLSQGLDRRLTAADDRHALALEQLGGEITRISDRLSERISQTERRSAQALEDIGRRLESSSSRIEQRYDRASGELAERMRLSEERTAALLSEARHTVALRGDVPIGAREASAPAVAAPTSAEVGPDWRSAAFPDSAFPDAPFADAMFEDPIFAEQQAWSADLAAPEATEEPEAEPAGEASPLETAARPSAAMVSKEILDAVLNGPLAEAETEAADGAEASPAAPAGPMPFGSRSPAAVAEDEPHLPRFVAPEAAPIAEAAPRVPAFGQSFGGADVADALAVTGVATHPEAFEMDDFDADTDFVDPRTLRAEAAQDRNARTRETMDAARAAMAPAEPEKKARSGFGLKRGGKSQLQERLDKQASRDSATVKKALGASALAVTLTVGGVLAYGQLTGSGLKLPGLDQLIPSQGGAVTPTAALAATPAAPTPAELVRASALYDAAAVKLDGDDPTALETLKQSAELGFGPAQHRLAMLYEEGGKGVSINPTEARVWARRAADSGDAKGMHAYAMHLYNGFGGERDTPGALTWLLRAAEKGLVDSQFNVAKLYETGDEGIAPNPAEAFKWYLIAARAGDGEAQAAVERLRAVVPEAGRTKARAEAEQFQVQPLV
jgi:localization factor PodJL